VEQLTNEKELVNLQPLGVPEFHLEWPDHPEFQIQDIALHEYTLGILYRCWRSFLPK
jgi:hypothetical protein